MKEIEFFIAEINDTKKMSNTFIRYITALDYTNKTILVFSSGSSGVSLRFFTTVIGSGSSV